MLILVRLLGWLVTAALIYAAVDGLLASSSRVPAAVNSHLVTGFITLLPLLFLHSVPVAHVFGVTRALRQAAVAERLDAAYADASAVLAAYAWRWPLATILAGLAAPMLGLLEIREDLPRASHAVGVCVLAVLHVLSWQRLEVVLSKLAPIVADARG